MISISDAPEYVEKSYERYKSLCSDIFELFQKTAEIDLIKANTDVLNYAGENSIIFVEQGYYKLYHDKKVLRLYSDSDIVIPPNIKGFTLVSDFAGNICVFNRDDFMKIISKDRARVLLWSEILSLENWLNLGLCSSYIGEDSKIDFKVKKYNQGDTIIQEGDVPMEIFEMIEGRATVYYKGKGVGSVSSGEVFGEISFFTGSLRTATVKADDTCLVRAISENDFESAIKYNPKLITAVAKGLASRIVQLNDKVS